MTDFFHLPLSPSLSLNLCLSTCIRCPYRYTSLCSFESIFYFEAILADQIDTLRVDFSLGLYSDGKSALNSSPSFARKVPLTVGSSVGSCQFWRDRCLALDKRQEKHHARPWWYSSPMLVRLVWATAHGRHYVMNSSRPSSLATSATSISPSTVLMNSSAVRTHPQTMGLRFSL